MTNLQATAELIFNMMYPTPDSETAITKEEVIASAKNIFAYQQLLMAWRDKREDGSFEVPSYLSTESEPLEVKDNSIDISGLDIMRSLPSEIFLQKVGGWDCQCQYIKSTINQTQLLCDDDSIGDARTYFLIGDKIRFPRGTHANKLPIIYANSGSGVDNLMPIDEAMATLVMDKLREQYLGKVAPVDVTNNTNANS